MLYDEDGANVKSNPFPIDDFYSAKTLQEIFPDVMGDFSGSLELLSPDQQEAMFAPLGLRFGQVLSTVATNDLTDRTQEIPPEMAEELPEIDPKLLDLFEPSGAWFFDFLSGPFVTTRRYVFFQALEMPNSGPPELQPQMRAVDDDFEIVEGGYDPELRVYVLNDRIFATDHVYRFFFAEEDALVGCHFRRRPVTGGLGDCNPLIGTRFDAVESSSKTAQAGGRSLRDRDAVLRRLRELKTSPSPRYLDPITLPRMQSSRLSSTWQPLLENGASEPSPALSRTTPSALGDGATSSLGERTSLSASPNVLKLLKRLMDASIVRDPLSIAERTPAPHLESSPNTNTVYFPQYADGDGFSMQITIVNSSATPAQASLRIFESAGMLRDLPGIGSDTHMGLDTRQTVVLRSDGTSSPVKTGYMALESDSFEISGLAVFKLSDGRETTVLPTLPGDSFTLYIERGGSIDTGVAVFRSDPGLEVMATLFDEAGMSVSSNPFPLQGLYGAKTLQEIFPDVRGDFSGSLRLQSTEAATGQFAPLGLRFGQVLSTVAGSDLTDRTARMPPEGEPPHPLFVVRRLVRPSGYWFFDYESPNGMTVHKKFVFFQPFEVADPEPDVLPLEVYGIDEALGLVLAGYSESDDAYLLLDPDTSGVDAYAFAFNDQGQASGCRHRLIPATGALSPCEPLTLTRLQFPDGVQANAAAGKTVSGKDTPGPAAEAAR